MFMPARDEESGERRNDKQMLADHKTTANALVWTWYLLSQILTSNRSCTLSSPQSSADVHQPF